MEIRIATEKDAVALFELNRLFENEATVEAIAESLQKNDSEVVCIAYEGNVAAGYCAGIIIRSMCYDSRRVDVESLFVREEYRKRGVAAALLKCLEDAITARGIYHFHIMTSITNERALALYKKIGYVRKDQILLEKDVE